MAQYIDKADVVAEIEKRIKEIDEIGTYLSPKGVLTNLLCHLDTLEVKESPVDAFIEKATSYIQQHWIWNTKIIEDFKNYMKGE